MTEIKLNDGEKVEGSLGLMALKNLRHKDKGLYNDANRIVFEGTKSVDDLTTAVYAGYVACCKETPKYSYDEFTKLLPDSLTELTAMVKRML